MNSIKFSSSNAPIERPWVSLVNLFRWKRSFYRLVIIDLLFFFALFLVLSITFNFGVDRYTRDRIYHVSEMMEGAKFVQAMQFIGAILIGQVVEHHFRTFHSLPWPDTMAMFLEGYLNDPWIKRQHVKGTMNASNFRCTIYRYYLVSWLLAYSKFSDPIRERFPDYETLARKHKLLTENELISLKQAHRREFDKTSVTLPYYSLPLIWCMQLIHHARKLRIIESDTEAASLRDELSKLGSSLEQVNRMYQYPFIVLATVQVITIALYSYVFRVAFRLATLTDIFDFFAFDELAGTNHTVFDANFDMISREGGAYLNNLSTTTTSTPDFDISNMSQEAVHQFGTILAAKLFVASFVLLQVIIFLAIFRTSLSMIWTFGGNPTSVHSNQIIDSSMNFYLNLSYHGFIREPSANFLEPNSGQS